MTKISSEMIINEEKYDIRKISTKASLLKTLETGLDDLYRAVFGAPPYNEVFEDGEVTDIFQEYLEAQGCIFLLCHRNSGRPVAFMVGVDAREKFNQVAGLDSVLKKDRRTAYLADDGVHESVRRQGVSTALKTALLTTYENEKYDQVLLRTRWDNYRQISAVNKAGGVIIEEAQQTVLRHTKNGNHQEDNRFFLFDFRNQNVVTQSLGQACIESHADQNSVGDIAIVSFSEAAKTVSIEDILRAYPSLSGIASSTDRGTRGTNAVFNGHLYLSCS